MTNDVFKQKNNVKRSSSAFSLSKVRIVSTVTATFALSLSLTLSSMAASSYDVEIAGGKGFPEATAVSEITTFKKDPVSIASDAGVKVTDSCIVKRSEGETGKSGKITVYRAGTAFLIVDGKETIVDTEPTVIKMLEKNGVDFREGDYISCDPGDTMFNGMKVVIRHAFNVYVKDGDEIKTLTTTGGKVGFALNTLGVTLEDQDELNYALDDELTDGMTIEVARCHYKAHKVREEYAYDVTEIKDPTRYTGQRRVLKKGENGIAEKIYLDKYIGDVCVSSDELTSNVIKEAVNEEVAVGTKGMVVPNTPYNTISPLDVPSSLRLDENGLPTNYSSYMDGVATAYCGDEYTASGLPAGRGYIAVDPRVIPYGTELYVVSLDGRYVYGYCIAADTGGFVEGGWADADLYMDTESECREFGIRGVRIYIL
ncbi:MAG: G5 domain-containing protein [Clostridiales bacterium]|nr:G5 domain-containing protein [Clostridiales bacterium]